MNFHVEELRQTGNALYM